MLDSIGRNIDYMRISVTDKCNLRCKYCMPEDVEYLKMSDLLTFEEIRDICTIAASLGISKIKVTGGEPLVRRGVESLVGMIKKIPGIENVTMTTNGILLKDKLDGLIANGLDAVNISLDTLDPAEFCEITGQDRVRDVADSIDAAAAAGIPVKINTVHRQELTEQTIFDLVDFVKGRPIDLRFIEIMPIGTGRVEKSRSNAEILQILEKRLGSPTVDRRVHGNGPAVYYRFNGMQGSIGLISAMHGKFCSSCNRIRMSAVGEIKSCLCYESTTDLRGPLRAGDKDKVRKLLEEAIYDKPREHCFENIEKITEDRRMISIGG